MGILFAFIAGLFTTLTNLCVRKGVDIRGNAKAFFVCQIFASTFFALVFGPLRQGDYFIPFFPSLLGVLAGLLLSVMLFSLGRALENGPPGLTFAILNSATVMPGFLMALAFGAAYGFLYNYWHAVGSILVLAGLFWGAKKISGMKKKNLWVSFATLMFLSHTLLLGLYQYRAMYIKHPGDAHLASEWFTPMMFFTCGCIQLLIYISSKQGRPQKGEVIYGVTGGLSNLLCTIFLLLATEQAGPLENAVIFPMFSVAGIVLTNFWSQKLYSEQVNWKACHLSAFGLVIGTVDWNTIIGNI